MAVNGRIKRAAKKPEIGPEIIRKDREVSERGKERGAIRASANREVELCPVAISTVLRRIREGTAADSLPEILNQLGVDGELGSSGRVLNRSGVDDRRKTEDISAAEDGINEPEKLDLSGVGRVELAERSKEITAENPRRLS